MFEDDSYDDEIKKLESDAYDNNKKEKKTLNNITLVYIFYP